jgi:hypothetical protein
MAALTGDGAPTVLANAGITLKVAHRDLFPRRWPAAVYAKRRLLGTRRSN